MQGDVQSIVGMRRCGTQHSFGVRYIITKGLLKQVRKGMLAITRQLGDPGLGVEGERQSVGGEKILAEDRVLYLWNSKKFSVVGVLVVVTDLREKEVSEWSRPSA